ncbi:MAG TPA: DoxX family protein [Myxococcaceae bacterium]|nr:DoxX family protein [Myxococcaceae bacterium]
MMRFLARLEPLAYDLLRLFSGAMFSVHGMQKLFGILTSKAGPAPFSQAWIGGVIELLCGVLIALGLFTRPAAFLASGTMAVAYFQFHHAWKLGGGEWVPVVNRGETAVLYCFVFLFIATRGGGRFGLDRARRRD